MKTTKLFLSVVLSFLLFTACEKDEDTPELVGTWETEKIETNISGFPVTMQEGDQGFDMMSIVIVFKDDGTVTYEANDAGTYVQSGSKVAIDLRVKGQIEMNLSGKNLIWDEEVGGIKSKYYFKKK